MKNNDTTNKQNSLYYQIKHSTRVLPVNSNIDCIIKAISQTVNNKNFINLYPSLFVSAQRTKIQIILFEIRFV